MIILRGVWCVFCFYTVFKDNLESGAKLAVCWLGGGSGKRRCQKLYRGFGITTEQQLRLHP